ncbi:MAG: hypothetical protein LAO07_10720 [Acidobacteriia bacterium]|nr:hypothetical protein [Terriglobia bacterium]
MDDDSDHFVDELLEASLQRYRSEEPRAGIENRILANVRASAAQQRRGIWIWALAAAAAALCIIAVVVSVSRRQPAPVPVPSPLAVTNPAPPNVVPREAPLGLKPIRRVRRAAAAPRRPEQFPTPAPLSAQEKLLLAYVSQTPPAELRMPVGPSPGAEPLEITELRVAPIEIKELPKPSE